MGDKFIPHFQIHPYLREICGNIYGNLWKIYGKYSWDDDIPNILGKIKFMFPSHQPVIYTLY
jgi:hypothetical protein